jgi:OOP family OmpA-OmpF porin
MIRATIAGAILLAGAVPLAAQGPGSIEAGVFGRYTHFSGDLALDDAFGAGARAGYFFSPILAAELDGSYATMNQGALHRSHLPVHLRAVLNLPFSDRFSAFLGTGPMLDVYGKDESATNGGVGSVMGIRYGVTSQLMLRLDAGWDWVMLTSADSPGYGNLGLTAGISWFPGRSTGLPPNGDEDEDGVRNADDACPGTPPASWVDALGCVRRSDSDGDGVIDINDSCPDTAAGVKVDATGCPLRPPSGADDQRHAADDHR